MIGATGKLPYTAPKVSVVMPSLNQAAFIRSAIESVLSQSHQDLELIVVDGGSTDGTQQVLEALGNRDKRLRWYSARDGGAAQAINKALSLSRGEIIGWLNSDDLYAEGAIERAVQFYAERPETILVYGAGEHIDEHGTGLGHYPIRKPPLTQEMLRESCPICQPTAFFRRKLLAEIGGLDSSLSLSFDYDYWIRAAKRFPYQIGFVEKVQAYSRLHANCKTMRQRREVALESMRVTARGVGHAVAHWFFTWLDDYFRSFPHGDFPAAARRAMDLSITEAKGYLSDGDKDVFSKRLSEDKRLALLNDEAYINIYSDGWVPSAARLRVRAILPGLQAVRLRCRHAAPRGGALTIYIRCSNGQESKFIVDKLGEFEIKLSIPEVISVPAYWTFTFNTDGAFIPAEHESNSQDNRILAFIVQGIDILRRAA